jgi:hypothetical protein
MSIEQKNEKNRKRREARQRNKGLPLKSESSRGSYLTVAPLISQILPFVPPFIWLMLG